MVHLPQEWTLVHQQLSLHQVHHLYPVESPAYVTSILARTNLFATRRAYVRNNIRRCAKMHGSCMNILTAVTQKANTEIAWKWKDMQCITRPSCVASLGLISALGAKILQLQSDIPGLCKQSWNICRSHLLELFQRHAVIWLGTVHKTRP